jgi:Cd2+/Zn2+-exporting ATPase/Cu+-exporting ATPase
MANLQTLEVPIKGMDCAECTQHVQHAISKLDGVKSVDVLLATEKAIIKLDPEKVDMSAIRKAVASAGEYSVPETTPLPLAKPAGNFNRQLMILLAIVFGIVLSIVIAGEWLGMFKFLDELVPFPIGVVIVIAGGWQIYRNVIRATFKRKIIAHTL